MIDFQFSSNPQLYFGPGKFKLLPELITRFGDKVLFITGAKSFTDSDEWTALYQALENREIHYTQTPIDSEPSPVMIDGIIEQCKGLSIDVVVAIGGGSVVDAGKAVSAMLGKKESVIEFLEGIGTQKHDGEKVPFIAVPTTAGTGSEATKNAVISQTGKNGFKKSLRHDNFIPDIALVDPQLTANCPVSITAACGMDALTQIIESFVSTKANAMTDSLSVGALTVLGDSLIRASLDSPHDIGLRSRISYTSYISGLTLANAGLGVVHGFASVIGGLFNIPHGVVCGTLLAPVCRANIESLYKTDPEGIALKKYNEAANLLDPSEHNSGQKEGAYHLLSLLDDWTTQLKISTLSSYGVTQKDIDPIVEATGQKNNPIKLSKKQLSDILQTRL